MRSTRRLRKAAIANRRNHRQLATWALAALALGVASCGSDADDADTSLGSVSVPDVGSSASSTTPTTTTTPPTTSAPTATTVVGPSGFDEWPTPAEPAPTLDELPSLLPAETIPFADDVVRVEWDADVEPDRVDYVQFLVADDGTSMLVLRSEPGQMPVLPDELRTDVDVPGWTSAFFSRSAPGFANLTLVDDGGTLDLNGRGLAEDDVLAAAGSLQRRAAGTPGWDIGIVPDGMSPIHEGWANGPSFRELDWYSNGARVAELTIAGGLPGLIDPQTSVVEQGLTVTDVAGAHALAVEHAGAGDPISLVMWSPQPEIVVYFGMRAPLAETLGVARSLESVDVAAWEAAGRPPVDAPDGCSSFRC